MKVFPVPRGQRHPDRVEDLQGPGQVAFIHGFPLKSGSLFPESGQPLFLRFGHRGRHDMFVHPDAADVFHHCGFDLVGVEGPARTRRPASLPAAAYAYLNAAIEEMGDDPRLLMKAFRNVAEARGGVSALGAPSFEFVGSSRPCKQVSAEAGVRTEIGAYIGNPDPVGQFV